MIISIIKVAGGNTTDGGVDTSWVLFWYKIKAAVAIIVVSVSAFRALFIAHQAMRYRSPAENGSSWNIWSRKSKGSRPEELPVPPAPVLSSVSTHIRGSQYGAGKYDGGDYDIELPLHGPGITVTQHIHSEKVGSPLLIPRKEMKLMISSDASPAGYEIIRRIFRVIGGYCGLCT